MKMEAMVTTVRIYIRIASVRKLSIVLTSALTIKKVSEMVKTPKRLRHTSVDDTS